VKHLGERPALFHVEQKDFHHGFVALQHSFRNPSRAAAGTFNMGYSSLRVGYTKSFHNFSRVLHRPFPLRAALQTDTLFLHGQGVGGRKPKGRSGQNHHRYQSLSRPRT